MKKILKQDYGSTKPMSNEKDLKMVKTIQTSLSCVFQHIQNHHLLISHLESHKASYWNRLFHDGLQSFLHEILAHSKEVIHDVKTSEMSRHRDNTDDKTTTWIIKAGSKRHK